MGLVKNPEPGAQGVKVKIKNNSVLSLSQVCMMTVTMLVEAKAVIPRLDRAIQSFQQVLDCPVKPDNDIKRKQDCDKEEWIYF